MWVPIIGGLVSAACGIREIAKGNIKNGLIDIGQGVIGVIPGVGPSICIGAAVVGFVAKKF